MFTDLDATLLDGTTYEPGPARACLKNVQQVGIVVVFCSAKTRSEQEKLRDELDVQGPFIVENGAAVWTGNGDQGGDYAVVFGRPYAEVRSALRGAALAAGVTVRGYGDMSTVEVAELTGLSEEAAQRARAREFTESFVIEEGTHKVASLRSHLAKHRLTLTRGARLWSVGGHHDKSTSVAWLTEWFASQGERPLTYGVGDSYNDVDMLAAVDLPMLVQQPDGAWADIVLPDLVHLPAAGPEGWCRAAERIMDAYQRASGDQL